MSNSEKDMAPTGDDGGWGDSEHTTVDPTLLDRLAALDAKEESSSAFPASSTVTLGMDDLLEVDGGGAGAGGQIPPPAVPTPSPPPPATPGPPTPDPFKEMPYGGPSHLTAGGDKTEVFVPAMDDEPTRAKLRVIQGGGQQKEYMLARDRMTLGRGTNNDIMVPDIAISRQHVEILRNSDGSFKLRDMNSGNGSKLNGTRIIESDLFGGDRIEIGGTVLEFVLTGPGASRSPSERQISIHPTEMSQNASGGFKSPVASQKQNFSGPNYSAGNAGYNATVTHFQLQQQQQAPAASRSPAIVVSAMIVFFGLILVALVGFLIFYVVTGQHLENGSQGPVKVVKSAAEYFEEGVALSKEKSWDEAKDKFSIAMEVGREERDFEVKLDAKRQIERVLKEKSFLESLEQARALMKEKEWVDALAKLEEIRSHSVYYSEARKFVEEAQTNYADQEIEIAEKAFEEKRFDEADELVASVIELVPEHKAANDLQKKLTDLPSEVHTPKAKDTTKKDDKTWAERAEERRKRREKRERERAERAAAASSAPSGENTTGTTPKTPAGKPKGKDTKAGGDKGTANFAPGRTMYRNRKFAEAVKYFEEIASKQEGFEAQKASTLARSIKSFEQSFTKGTSAYQANNFSQAARYLSNAARLDKAISGSGGFFQGQLREMLAESYFKQAQSAFTAHNYARAGSHAKKARSYKPGHPGVQSLFIKLEDKGKSMYIDAVKKKASDPKLAKRIAKSIVSMLPESSNTFKKAKKLLQEL